MLLLTESSTGKEILWNCFSMEKETLYILSPGVVLSVVFTTEYRIAL